MNMKPEILIVDDEADIRSMLTELLEDEGYSCRAVSNAKEARDSLQAFLPALVILDIWMSESDMDGLELQKWIRKLYPHVPAIMISGHGNIETAVKAMKDGAYDFIEKPFKSDRLLILIERALEAASLQAENVELKKQSPIQSEFLGSSSAAKEVRGMIEKVANSNSRVMISGPLGSGKELVARSIHQLSARQGARFVPVNCALLEPDRVTVELFGTEGSKRDRIIGLFEQAHGGTLYFDEIGDLPLDAQGKLVRAVQDQSFRRLGGASEIAVDIRVISASNLNLAEEVANGNLREDLYYRLSVVPISVPSLAERKEDIAELANYYLEQANTVSGNRLKFSDKTLAFLQLYAWPGNVTQLRNVIDWLTIMVKASDNDGVIEIADLPPELTGSEAEETHSGFETMVGMPIKVAREEFEKQYLVAQLLRFDSSVSRTAEFIGMERAALHRKLKSLGIKAEGEKNVSS